jgi:predicted  nucleic acid-binding Zn-ribbon protein
MKNSAERAALHQQAAQAQERAEHLKTALADLAGRIAATEDKIADGQEALVSSDVTDLAELPAQQAATARAFAQHERDEQERWSAPAAGAENGAD